MIKGPVHLSVGQEAIAVGISQNIKKTDHVFGNHRSHAHLMALNPNFHKLFAEILGKKTGFSKGMGGSMHLFDKTSGFYGSVPIVAGTIPLAVGAALATKLKKKNYISVVYFGDGAIEEGVVHECLNFSKIYNLPILFVGENNLFASHMHISQRQPNNKISRFAIANKIPHKIIDGNDVIKIGLESKKFINEIRSGKGPRFLELLTYRWYGHVDWKEDLDVGVKRSIKDINNWKKKDPIKKLLILMKKLKIFTERDEVKLKKKVEKDIQIAWNKAMKDLYPSKNSILSFVYSKKN